MATEERDWQLWEDQKVVDDLDDQWTDWRLVRHRRKLQSELRKLKTGRPDLKTLLDFGCGTGNYYPLITELGFEYEGVDVTEKMMEKAREKNPGIKVSVDDIYKSKFDYSSFDVVLNNDVIIHLPDPLEPIKTLYRVARKFVVLKVSYTTRRMRLLEWIVGTKASHKRRNRRGFIEHFYNINDMEELIRKECRPKSLRVEVYRSFQRASPFQVIFTIEAL